MALMFIPPTAPLVPPTVNPRHPGHALFRHYRPWDAGPNLWLLADGTVTPIQPESDEGVVTLHGGHQHVVTEAQAAALQAQGYTVVEIP